jgi:hypothetical protein
MSWGNCNLQASDYLGEIDMDREFSARFKCLYRRDQISDQVDGSAQRAACRPMTGQVREVLALKPDREAGSIDRNSYQAGTRAGDRQRGSEVSRSWQGMQEARQEAS